MSLSGVPLGSDTAILEEEAVPSIGEDSSKEDPLVDDARDSVEEPLVDGTASQEENGNTKRRPRSVVNVDFFIDAILLLIRFFPNNMGNGKKGKHYVKNLLFIFKKPSKTRKIRVVCRDFCKNLSLYSIYNAFDYIWIVKSVH